MTQWFTADLHLGHARLLDLSPARGGAFSSAGEMTECLVENWNSVVRPEDTVWVLGDVDMHGKPANLAHVSRLAGTKLLVAGNHDACWAGFRDGWKHRDAYLAAGLAAVLDFASTLCPRSTRRHWALACCSRTSRTRATRRPGPPTARRSAG